ncbi:MAG: YhjD/YihY/BrkB family envelope integrity protein [Myxococcota bacterium]|nr:YhjD/YihY/BrkB family envelope integrity protein [Myxococcota bacterium]
MFLFELFERVKRFLRHDIWVNLHLRESRRIWFMQVLYLSILRFQVTRCMVRASSLTTVTLISIVPVLAFAFSVAKGFGAYQSLQTDIIAPSLEQWFGSQEAPELRSAIDQTFAFVEHTDLSRLGLAGLLTVLYAVIRLLSAVEEAFNDLWRIDAARNFIQKISDYLSVVVTVPIVVFIVFSMTTALKSGFVSDYINQMILWGGWGVSLVRFSTMLVLWFAFSFAYAFIPNVKVNASAAASGGLVGSLLWLLFHYSHVGMQMGVASYNALYAGFSAFPIFMLWIFFSWVAVLVGASFAAAAQTRQEHQERIIRENLGFRTREWISIRLMLHLTDQFVKQRRAIGLEQLSEELRESQIAVYTVILELKEKGFVEETKEGGAVLMRAPEMIHVLDILDSIKGDSLSFVSSDLHEQAQKVQTEVMQLALEQPTLNEKELTKEGQLVASLRLQESGLLERVDSETLQVSEALLVGSYLEELESNLRLSSLNITVLELWERLKSRNVQHQVEESVDAVAMDSIAKK